MSFNKLTAFTQKVADAADQLTGNTAETKAIFDAAPEELRTYFNNLVDALKSTASGDSGAKNTGATAITGLTGNDIQSLLESLKTYADNKFKNDLTWNNVVFANAFTDYTADVSYPRTSYSKDSVNIVRLQGLVKASSFGNNNAMFNIPNGYRIPYIKDFTCAAYHSTYGNGIAIVEVHTNGNVTTKATMWNGNYGTAPTWVDLASISYPLN